MKLLHNPCAVQQDQVRYRHNKIYFHNHKSFPVGNTTSPPTNAIISVNLTCNEDLGFVEMNNTCQPLCSRWMLYSKLGGDIADGIVLTCALVGLLGGVAVLFFSVVRYERV